MKRFLSIFALIFWMFSAYGQSFKSVYESLQVNDRFSNMMNLQHYQSTNPNHAVVYFLLADIHEQYMRETNPISMFDFLETNYYQTNTYLGLVKLKLDDKQARQDRDYFGNISIVSEQRKVGLEDIVNEVDIRSKAAQEYFNNAKTIHDSYVLFAQSYNACLFRYRELLAAYPNYKTLYMITSRALRSDIVKLKSDFDTALQQFATYQKACAGLPHLLKVNTYSLKPITTYRLEGLVESDFMLPVVELWDFGAWASDFLQVLDTDITFIRNGLHTEHLALSQQIEKFKNQNLYFEKPSFYKPEDKFQNLIAKYDREALVNNYIDYQNSKIQFLRNTRLLINDVSDTSNFYLINKLRFYQNLAMQKQALNAQAVQLKGRIQFGEIEKYIDFFDQNFNGMDGFARWCVVEQYDNDQIFNKNLENLNDFIVQDARKNYFDGTYLEFQKKNIPFGITRTSDSLVDSSIQVQHKFVSPGNQHYLLGTESKAGQNSRNFMLKADRNRKVTWIVYPENFQTKAHQINNVQQAVLLDNGHLVIAGTLKEHVSDTSIKTTTYVAQYDELGKEKRFRVLSQNQTVNHLLVDEINEEYLLISSQLVNNVSDENQMVISLFSFNDSLLWQHQLKFAGKLVDVLVSNANYLLVCNYQLIETGNKTLKTEGGELSLATLFVKRDGNEIILNQYQTEGKIQIEHAYKLTNSVINYIGKAGKNTSEATNFYMLVDEEGLPIFYNSTSLKYSRHKVN